MVLFQVRSCTFSISDSHEQSSDGEEYTGEEDCGFSSVPIRHPGPHEGGDECRSDRGRNYHLMPHIGQLELIPHEEHGAGDDSCVVAEEEAADGTEARQEVEPEGQRSVVGGDCALVHKFVFAVRGGGGEDRDVLTS